MGLDSRTQASLEAAVRRVFAEHGHDPNLTGCGFGYRRRGGERTTELAVIAMVGRKVSAGLVSRQRLLPAKVGEWGVDVVEVRRPSRHAATSATSPTAEHTSLKEVWRPVIQGVSIGNLKDDRLAGTLGAIVVDKSDSTVCVLSSNHVIGRNDNAANGEAITQPAPADDHDHAAANKVATFKRAVPISNVPGTTTNHVDAAIARLDDPSGYSADVAFGLMKPISPTHPAVGMVVAGDPGTNCFLTRMDNTLTALNVRLIQETDGSICTAKPALDMNIEKVGRSSGYSSSTVDALGVIVKIDFSPAANGSDVRPMADMIWTQSFALDGDSGAVVCAGGNGHGFVEPKPQQGCDILGATGTYYNLPLTDDNALTSQIRDQFLAQSQLGRLLAGMIYQNSQVLLDRLAGKTASAYEQGYAKTYYQRYRDLVAGVLGNPNSTTTVTSNNVADLQNIIIGMSGGGPLNFRPVLTPAETSAAMTLCNDVFAKTVGMNYQQIVAFMNQASTYHTVVDKLNTLPSVAVVGPVTAG
jgi:hypothetical protein